MKENWMQRALDLAHKGWGTTNPNPLVGAVVVNNGRVVGEGYHERAGEAHAEVMALQQAGEYAKDADMYVTLEPCCHCGRTPPCTQAIVRSGIRKVFVAMKDPNPRVAGGGIGQLKAHGIEVETGILEKEAESLNEIFVHYISNQTPYMIYKAAMSLDGKTAAVGGHSQWITGETARKHVHEFRHRVSAVMVGIETVLKDDPLLTVRHIDSVTFQPYRIVADSKGRIPLDAKMVTDQWAHRTIIATTEKMSHTKEQQLKELGVVVIRTDLLNNRVHLVQLMKMLGKMEIDSILLEGGSALAADALKLNLINRVMFYIAPKLIGGSHAPGVLAGDGIISVNDSKMVREMKTMQLGEDLLITGKIGR